MHATTPFALEIDDENVSTRTPTISGVAGDLWLAMVGARGSETIDDPSGWDTPFFDDVHDNDSTFKVLCAARRLSGSVSDPDFTITGGTTDEWSLFLLSITGAHASSYLDAQAVSKNEISANVTCPTVTTTVANCLIIRMFFARGIVTLEDTNYPGSTTGLFVRDCVPMEDRSTIGAAWHTQASAGATGTAVFSGVKASNDNFGATVAIAPA